MNNDNKQKKFVLDKDKIRTLVMITINTAILSFIYFAGIKLGDENRIAGGVVFFSYATAFSAFLVAYIIYNRAFTRNNLTPDMISDNIMTPGQKEEYIADGKRRLKKSRWMLSVIIPLLVPMAIDSFIMYVWDPNLSKLF